MKKTDILLIGHGKIGPGMLTAVNLIYGKVDNITAVETYMDSNFSLPDVVKEIIDNKKNHNLVIITDVLGGSVNNEFIKYLSTPDFYLVTGMNLPLIIELISQIQIGGEIAEIIRKTLQPMKDSIVFVNDIIQNDLLEEEF